LELRKTMFREVARGHGENWNSLQFGGGIRNVDDGGAHLGVERMTVVLTEKVGTKQTTRTLLNVNGGQLRSAIEKSTPRAPGGKRRLVSRGELGLYWVHPLYGNR